jgi:archaellum component FlaG (FlaF/FlaG flagellin family)
MKKIVFALAIVSAGLMSFTTTSTSSSTESNNTEEMVGSTFKLVNDTGSKVKVSHKGGSVSLNNGGSTSLSCTTDKDISVDGNVVFTVSSDLCGKTVKLSSYM